MRAVDDDGGAGSDATQSTAALSRELADFLVELSIALQKHAIYPSGHPLLDVAVDLVMNRLALLLLDRNSLSIGIARRQLIIEGVATDPNHPLLKELAGRLHKNSLGAVKFVQGFSREELADALATIAADAARTEQSLGDKADELSERWTNVRLFPLNYERLELLYQGRDSEGEDSLPQRNLRAARLWIGMARAAMMLDKDALLEEDAMNPLVVAEAINKRQHEAAYDQVIVGYMLQIAEELKKQGDSPETVELQKRISEMVRKLSPATLKKLLQMGGDRGQRRQFLLNASQGMTVEAVLDLVQASSEQGRQTISDSMMRLFAKLSRYAQTDADPVRRENAEASVREHMTKLISEWNLADPNPSAYSRVLQKLTRTQATTAHPEYIDCEPERILQIGFEIGSGGPRFDASLDTLFEQGRFATLLDLVEHAPNKVFAAHAWVYLDSHDILGAALHASRPDFAVLERIVRRKRALAIDQVLDAADQTKDSRIRQQLLNVVLVVGDDAGPFIVRRIGRTRADLRRDLFLLLGKLQRIPLNFDTSRFLLHPDDTVRREVVRLLLKYVETREEAIIAGVTDADERAVFYALTAAQEGGCPPRAAVLIRRRIEAGDMDSSLVALAIRVLAATDTGAVPVVEGEGRTSQVIRAGDVEAAVAGAQKTLNWLIARVAQRSRFLRQWKLQPKSAQMLAALGALSSYWMNEPDVQAIIAVAHKSNDPEIKKATTAPPPRATGKFKAYTE